MHPGSALHHLPSKRERTNHPSHMPAKTPRALQQLPVEGAIHLACNASRASRLLRRSGNPASHHPIARLCRSTLEPQDLPGVASKSRITPAPARWEPRESSFIAPHCPPALESQDLPGVAPKSRITLLRRSGNPRVIIHRAQLSTRTRTSRLARRSTQAAHHAASAKWEPASQSFIAPHCPSALEPQDLPGVAPKSRITLFRRSGNPRVNHSSRPIVHPYSNTQDRPGAASSSPKSRIPMGRLSVTSRTIERRALSLPPARCRNDLSASSIESAAASLPTVKRVTSVRVRRIASTRRVNENFCPHSHWASPIRTKPAPARGFTHLSQYRGTSCGIRAGLPPDHPCIFLLTFFAKNLIYESHCDFSNRKI
jgi:hypothetical protein